MDNTEKLRILLQHWIDHNGGHVAEFAKWKELMAADEKKDIVKSLEMAMQQMNKVSDILRNSLDALGGPAAGSNTSDHHHTPHN